MAKYTFNIATMRVPKWLSDELDKLWAMDLDELKELTERSREKALQDAMHAGEERE